MTLQEKIEFAFQKEGWDFSSEAYYKLDYTPFMSVIEEVIKEVCQEQKQICADNAEADFEIPDFIGWTASDIEVYVLKESILQCPNAV